MEKEDSLAESYLPAVGTNSPFKQQPGFVNTITGRGRMPITAYRRKNRYLPTSESTPP